jgi:hypothetical protein
MTDFSMERIGMIMEPRAGDPHEVEGVLNPAAARTPDGKLYLFLAPRVATCPLRSATRTLMRGPQNVPRRRQSKASRFGIGGQKLLY